VRTELFLILLVIAVLIGLTALRYRKQIVAAIQFGRMLKEAKDASTSGRIVSGEPKAVQLVHCTSCGLWVTPDKAISRGGKSYCSTDCLKVTAI